MVVFVFKRKTAYERRISDWSSDVCSSDLGSREWPPPSAGRGAACAWWIRPGTRSCSGGRVRPWHWGCSWRQSLVGSVGGRRMGRRGGRGGWIGGLRPRGGLFLAQPAQQFQVGLEVHVVRQLDRKSTRLNSSH